MASGRSKSGDTSSGNSTRGKLSGGIFSAGRGRSWRRVAALATVVGVGSWTARGQVQTPPTELPGSPFAGNSIDTSAGVYGPIMGGLHTHIVPGENQASLVVVDPQRQAVAVYHISHGTGAIELKSARKIRWDLELTEYNSSAPLPEDIRKGLARQR